MQGTNADVVDEATSPIPDAHLQYQGLVASPTTTSTSPLPSEVTRIRGEVEPQRGRGFVRIVLPLKESLKESLKENKNRLKSLANLHPLLLRDLATGTRRLVHDIRL